MEKNELQEPKYVKIKAISKVYGVGPVLAKELLDYGFESIDGLRERVKEAKLGQYSQIGLQYSEDLQRAISRHEVFSIWEIFKAASREI